MAGKAGNTQVKKIARISQTALTGVLGLACLVGLYVIAAQTGWRLDTTGDKRHSLAPATAQVLEMLPSRVLAVAFYRPQEPGKDKLGDLLELCSEVNPDFTYEFVDPDRSPLRTRELGATQTGELVLVCQDRSEKIFMPDEEKITNALMRVTDEERAVVYFVQGHGEASLAGGQGSVSRFKGALEKQGVEAKPLTLARVAQVPDDASVVALVGPNKDFLEQETRILTEYFNDGGRVLYALDADSTTNFDLWMLKNARLERLPGLVLDPVGQAVLGNYFSPVAQSYPFQPIGSGFDLITIYPTAAALVPVGASQVRGPLPLVMTSESAWLETDMNNLGQGKARFDQGADRPGPLWLAGVYDPEQSDANSTAPRMVVFADQNFVTDQYVGLSGNLDMALDSVNWLLSREDRITVKRPDPIQDLLFPRPGQSLLLTWTPMIIVPAMTMVLGIVVAVRRKRG